MKLLMDLVLEKESDPDDLGNCIAEIEAMYWALLSEKEKVAAVLKVAGEHYFDII